MTPGVASAIRQFSTDASADTGVVAESVFMLVETCCHLELLPTFTHCTFVALPFNLTTLKDPTFLHV